MGWAWKLHEKIKLASLWYADADIEQMCSELSGACEIGDLHRQQKTIAAEVE